jgi:hypothetical protein
MKNLLLIASILACLAGTSSPVLAQRNDNPNMKMFYMARQQIQITDDAPAVNDMRTNPQNAQQAAAQAAATAGQALPRAGFSSNMNAYRTPASTGLPTVNNGVPAKLPETMTGINKKGLKAGDAGKLKAKAPAGPRAAAPVAVKTYQPYATAPVAQTGQTGSLLNSSTTVRGSVLHWNKRH